MQNKRFLLFILAVVQFTHIIDFMIVMPLGKQFMEVFDISPQQFSWIVSSYAVTAFFAGILSAMFIDRFDRKKALLWLFLGFTIGTFACSIAPSYSLFLLARSLTGCFGGILAALVLSIVADLYALEERASAMGIIMTAFSAASIIGVPTGLYLAAQFNWRMPFISVGVLSIITLIFVLLKFPSMSQHLESGKVQMNPIKSITNILSDKNQLLALAFTMILMLGHFSIIPFIAPYMQLNIGFSDFDVAWIYGVGGALTVVCLPLFGKIADRVGNFKVFWIASCFALFSIFAITNLPPVSIAVALIASSSYFVVASGRSVPATTMVTSVVKPESRGSFMSIRSSANEAALAISSIVAGAIVSENPDGSLVNYEYVGYIAIGMSILAIWVASKLKAVA